MESGDVKRKLISYNLILFFFNFQEKFKMFSEELIKNLLTMCCRNVDVIFVKKTIENFV